MRALVLAAALVGTTSHVVADPRHGAASGITIASSDQSPGVLDAHERKRHGEIVRRALLDVLEPTGGLATRRDLASPIERPGTTVRHAGIGGRRIDIAIVAWRVTSTGPTGRELSVSTELRAVICDDRGKMLSIVTGRASISVPARSARLAELREQVLAEAIGGMSLSLKSQTRRATS
jgi:hypothetical protein